MDGNTIGKSKAEIILIDILSREDRRTSRKVLRFMHILNTHTKNLDIKEQATREWLYKILLKDYQLILESYNFNSNNKKLKSYIGNCIVKRLRQKLKPRQSDILINEDLVELDEHCRTLIEENPETTWKGIQLVHKKIINLLHKSSRL